MSFDLPTEYSDYLRTQLQNDFHNLIKVNTLKFAQEI